MSRRICIHVAGAGDGGLGGGQAPATGSQLATDLAAHLAVLTADLAGVVSVDAEATAPGDGIRTVVDVRPAPAERLSNLSVTYSRGHASVKELAELLLAGLVGEFPALFRRHHVRLRSVHALEPDARAFPAVKIGIAFGEADAGPDLEPDVTLRVAERLLSVTAGFLGLRCVFPPGVAPGLLYEHIGALQALPGKEAIAHALAGTGLGGWEEAFTAAAARSGVPVALLVAMAAASSDRGRDEVAMACGNPLGMGAAVPGPRPGMVRNWDGEPGLLRFESAGVGVMAAAQRLASHHLRPGAAGFHGATLRGLSESWNRDPEWRYAVARILEGMRAEAAPSPAGQPEPRAVTQLLATEPPPVADPPGMQPPTAGQTGEEPKVAGPPMPPGIEYEAAHGPVYAQLAALQTEAGHNVQGWRQFISSWLRGLWQRIAFWRRQT